MALPEADNSPIILLYCDYSATPNELHILFILNVSNVTYEDGTHEQNNCKNDYSRVK
jgi:hypothetical protein